MLAQRCANTMALRRANMLAHFKADDQKLGHISLTDFHPKITWRAYVGQLLGYHNTFNIKHNQIMFLKQATGVHWPNVGSTY